MTRLAHILTVPQTAATFLRGQLRWMRERGFEVTVITSPGPRLEELAVQEGVDWRVVAMTRTISPLRDLGAIAQMTRVLRELQPDIVHAHTPKAGLVGMLAAHHCDVPWKVYHLHGLRNETVHGARRLVLASAERLTCRLADRVLCVSPSLRAAALEQRLVTPDRCSVPASGSINGLPLSEFDPAAARSRYRARVRREWGIPANARCLGFVGRLVRDKGICELHAAWQLLRRMFPDLYLLLVGPWEAEDPVPPHVRMDLQSDPRVRLIGLDWHIVPYYAAMDVFVLPTHREGLGNVLLEAAAMELPIVTCRVTGCVDAVRDGATAQLIPPRDGRALADAVTNYLENPTMAETHGRAGRRYVRDHFRPLRVWQGIEQEYRRGIQDPPERPAVSSLRSAA